MREDLRLKIIIRLAAIVVVTFIFLAGLAYSKVIPTGTKIDMVRFDAVIKLNAPLLRTHVVLFARYWVAPDYYNVAVVWAEPEVGILNYPAYPPTLNISSSKKKFSMSNRFLSNANSSFSKPLGNRGVFYDKFNSYNISNMRFAETEALASRIYKSDLREFGENSNGDFQTIDVKNSTNENDVEREVAKLNARFMDDRISALNLLDTKENLIKSVEYEYSKKKGQFLLHKQNIVLPERTIMVGYRGKGATIKINNIERTYKELPGFHHKGGRLCTVQYKSMKMDKKLLTLPVSIIVRRAGTNDILREAHLSNFVSLKLSAEEADQAALQFSQFDDKELKVRDLFDKYWLKDQNDIDDADAKTLKQLRKHFGKAVIKGKTADEKLKSINMLLKLDWIQRDKALKKHFKKYLAILTANNLNQVLLWAGLHAIDTTIQWGNFSEAELLLKEWTKRVITTNKPEEILSFSQNQIKYYHLWTIARLLEECLKSYKNWRQERFDSQALRCMALYQLSEMIKEPSKIKNDCALAQAGWASWSIGGTDNLFKITNQSLDESMQTFDGLDKPTKMQRYLKRQLDEINQRITQTEN